MANNQKKIIEILKELAFPALDIIASKSRQVMLVQSNLKKASFLPTSTYAEIYFNMQRSNISGYIAQGF